MSCVKFVNSKSTNLIDFLAPFCRCGNSKLTVLLSKIYINTSFQTLSIHEKVGKNRTSHFAQCIMGSAFG